MSMAELEADPTPCRPRQPEIIDPATLLLLVALGRLVVVAPESVRDHLSAGPGMRAGCGRDADDRGAVVAGGAWSRAPATFVHTATTVARMVARTVSSRR